MRLRTIVISALILAITAGTAGAATAPSKASATRPVVLVFETEKGTGADKSLAASATRAVCVYLRETKRVDAITFDRESPTVLRAIMDKQITADQVASYSSQAERIVVAKALGYEYAAGGDVSIKDNQVQFKLWLAKADGGKKDKWESTTLAEAGGSNAYENAMQSASSAAVMAVARQSFGNLAAVSQPGPTTGSETTAIKPDLATPPVPPGAAEYTAQGDASLQAGNIAVAIQQYQQAANADPGNPDIRLKLADAFMQKGLYAQASATLSRAELLGANSERMDAARKKLDALQANSKVYKQEAVRVEPRTPANSNTAEAQAAAASAKTAVEKIIAGDKLWRNNKPDEAADAYKDAIKLNPGDWRAYERLALVTASVSMFADSRAVLERLKKVQPEPPADATARRYSLLSTIATQWLNALLKQYDDESAAFVKGTMTRESYYNSVKGLSGRLESMAKFLDAIDVPSDRRTANLHRSLACGLVSQAASSLQEYLETNNKESKASAETFVAQAKKELDTVKSLEGKSAVQKQTASVSSQESVSQPPATPSAADAGGNAAAEPNETATDAITPDQPSPDNSGQDEASPTPPGPPEETGVDEAPGPDPNPPGPPDTAPAPPPRGPQQGPPPPLVPPGVEIL